MIRDSSSKPPCIGTRSTRVFVGRDREISEFEEALEEVAGRRGQVVLVSGEAGIGKTRLAGEFARVGESRGAQVLWGRSWEHEGAPPYWPWQQLLRSWRASVGKGIEFVGDLEQEQSYLAQILAELQACPGGVAVSAESEHARFYLFDAVARLLRSAASERPLMLLLDDLHGADAPSLLLLTFVSRALGDAELLIVGTFRPDEVQHDTERAQLISELSREARRLPLGGLSEDEVRSFISEGFGVASAQDLAAAIHLSGAMQMQGASSHLAIARRRFSLSLPGTELGSLKSETSTIDRAPLVQRAAQIPIDRTLAPPLGNIPHPGLLAGEQPHGSC